MLPSVLQPSATDHVPVLADEVRRLLDDIKDAGVRDYYLQPVVVKRLDDGRWELVDGQQRLL